LGDNREKVRKRRGIVFGGDVERGIVWLGLGG
jgi:hypothetical protein